MGSEAQMTEPNFNEMLAVMRGVDLGSFRVNSRTAKFAEFPVDEYRLRYAKACKLMEAEGLDALLVTQDIDVRFFAGYLSVLWCSRFRSYVCLLPRDESLGPTLIVPAQETGNAMHTSWVADVLLYPDQENSVPYLAQAIRDKGLSRGKIGTELGFGQRLGMPLEDLERLKTAIAPAEIVSGTPVIQAVRMVKSPAEIERIRRACEISQVSARAGFEALTPGMTERELAKVMGAAMYAEGAEFGTSPSFFSLQCSPGRSQMVNALASDYELVEGDMVMIDAGAVYDGYATDFIRQACLGEPSPERRKWFDICVEANDACVEAIRPGVTGADVYEAGMAVFEREGLLDYNLLTIVGHGCGVEVHEVPWLGERDTVYTSGTVLEPGMVVCVEPVIAGMDGPEWREGIFIVEDKVMVTETGREVLTESLDKDLWVQPVGAAVTA
jgi:Xaa-Pro aminopeptidase